MKLDFFKKKIHSPLIFLSIRFSPHFFNKIKKKTKTLISYFYDMVKYFNLFFYNTTKY